jgi:hypothetical protein
MAIGGALGLLFILALMSGGSLASAEQVAQAATATPRPSVATSTPIACTTQPQGVQVVVENPSPGDVLSTGTSVVINGVAFDTRSTTGPGIASVSAYLGNRDTGGMFLGSATLGQPNPLVSSGSQLADAGFTLRTSTLPSGNGGRSLFIYAKSAVDGTEGILEIPIFLNAAPTPVKGQVPTPVLPTPAPCTPTPTATATTAPAPAAAAPVAAAATPTPTTPSIPTPTPFSLTAPLAPAPTLPPVSAPAPAAAVPTPVAVAPVATTAPRGGGIPSELGLILVGLGAAVVAGGLALRRREQARRQR